MGNDQDRGVAYLARSPCASGRQASPAGIPCWAWATWLAELVVFVLLVVAPAHRVRDSSPRSSETPPAAVMTSHPTDAPATAATSSSELRPEGADAPIDCEEGDEPIATGEPTWLPRPNEAWPPPHPDPPLPTLEWILRGRFGGRTTLARRGGGNDATERAVLLGLEWLAKHQDSDGKWDGDGFVHHDPAGDVCTGTATLPWIDPGLTGLATLAFLGAGSTHRYGRFKDSVRMAVLYLMTQQAADGSIGGRRRDYLYNHAICALALTEDYAMTKSPLVKVAAQKSIEYLIATRAPGLAWRHGERDGNHDLSVTGWCVAALRMARSAELSVGGLDLALRQTAAWVESITDDESGVSAGGTAPPTGGLGPTTSRGKNANHTPTAIATMCRHLCGYARTDSRLNQGAMIVASMPPMWNTGSGSSTVDYYYWHFGTLAMFHVGGERWKEWNRCMKAAIVTHQHRKPGSARGSWDPIDARGAYGGRVYATAINVLTLEVYYRYGKRQG